MAKIDGFVQLTCDRCGKTEYAAEKSPTTQLYKTIRRVTAADVDQSRFLCAACKLAYNILAAKQDTDFIKFMNES